MLVRTASAESAALASISPGNQEKVVGMCDFAPGSLLHNLYLMGSDKMVIMSQRICAGKQVAAEC